VGHFAGALQRGAQCAFRCQRETVVGGLSVDQEAVALGREVGGAGARRVSFLTGDKQETDLVSLGAQLRPARQ